MSRVTRIKSGEEKKGKRDPYALFSPRLSLGRSHESCTRAANRRRKCDRNYRDQPLTIAVVITCDRALAVEKLYNIAIESINISLEGVPSIKLLELDEKTAHDSLRMKIGSRATNGNFPASRERPWLIKPEINRFAFVKCNV